MDEALPAAPRRRNEPTPRSGFITGLDIATADERAKQEARSKRFNDVEFNPIVEDAEAADKRRARQTRFGIEPEQPKDVDEHFEEQPENERHDVDLTIRRRWDTIHLYGNMMNMSTKDILKYFEDYGPSLVEWIDDSTCNIVFGDEFSSSRALRGLSQAIPSQIQSLKDLDNSSMVDDIPDLPEDKLELVCWRGAIEYRAHEQFLMRIATTADVKPEFAKRKPSKYYAQIKKSTGGSRRKRNKRKRGNRASSMDIEDMSITVTQGDAKKGRSIHAKGGDTDCAIEGTQSEKGALDEKSKSLRVTMQNDAPAPAASPPMVITVPITPPHDPRQPSPED